MNRLCFLALLAVTFALGGCSLDRLPFVYKPDIHQGMIVTQDMVNQLKAGMSRRQVAFVMGPPVIIDSFHPDRWIYIQAAKPGGGKFESQQVTAHFENDRLVAVTGDLPPADPALARKA